MSDRPLTEPMKHVLTLIAEGMAPGVLYPAGQLRLITNGLFVRGMIKRTAFQGPWKLTPRGRNYITALRVEEK